MVTATLAWLLILSLNHSREIVKSIQSEGPPLLAWEQRRGAGVPVPSTAVNLAQPPTPGLGWQPLPQPMPRGRGGGWALRPCPY